MSQTFRLLISIPADQSGSSPDGTLLTAPTVEVLTDTVPAVWSFGAVTGSGYELKRNGTVNTTNKVKVGLLGGIVYTLSANGTWYKFSGGTWIGVPSDPFPPPLELPDQYANGQVALPLAYQVTATGGSPPYTFSLVAPYPQGMAISQSGLLTWTPQASGSFMVTVQVMGTLLYNTALGSVLIAVVPKQCSNVAGAEVSSTVANWTWTCDSLDLNRYVFRLYASDGTTLLRETSIAANPGDPGVRQETNLTPGATYIGKAAAANGYGTSAFAAADPLTMSGGASAPGAPSLLLATAVSSTSIDLAWTNADSLDTGIQIWVSLVNNTSYGSTPYATTAAHAQSYTVGSLPPSTQVFFKVRAHNDAGDSAYSNEANATTQAGSGDAFGLTVTSSHPRLLFNDSATMTQAQTWWAAHAYTPAANAMYDQAFAYAMSGNATYLSNVKTLLTAWFKNWAYQGTVNTSGMVAVGPYASNLAPGSTASDYYRWGESIPVAIDWVWNGLTAQERLDYANGFTMTWDVAGTHFGETVTIPGYKTLVTVMMTRTWGGKDAPQSNYFWGCFRNEINAALLFHDEDISFYNTVMAFTMGATNSRLSYLTTFMETTGEAVGGLPVEGAEYGQYMMAYPIVPLLSMRSYGRDLFSELDWYQKAMYHLIYTLTPKPTKYGGVNPDYYQLMAWADIENDYGYPHAALSYYADYAQMIAIRYASSDIGKYARYWLTLTGNTPIKHLQAIDPGGVSTDWRGVIGKTWRYSGSDWYIRHTAWDTNETVWYLQGKTIPSGHGNDDYGTLQTNRKGKWLSKESSGYQIPFARLSFQSTVGASPVPSTTQFNIVNLPTTLTFYAVSTKIKFVTGALAGTTATVSSVVAATGVVTLSAAVAQAPAAGDLVAMEFVGTASRPTDRSATGTMSHSSLMIAMTGYANAGMRLAVPGVSTQFFNEQTGYAAIGYDLTNLYRGVNDPGHANQVPDYTTRVVREFYFLDALETVVQLDRVTCKTFGNSAFPQWADTVMPVHWLRHYRNTPVVDGANKWTHTDGTQVERGFTLLPTSPLYNIQPMDNFSGTKETSLWYLKRLEVQDSGGAAQRYFLSVLQARDTTEADIVTSITAEDAGTWTVGITHATKGNATLVLNKGATASQGTVTLS